MARAAARARATTAATSPATGLAACSPLLAPCLLLLRSVMQPACRAAPPIPLIWQVEPAPLLCPGKT